MSRTHSAGPRLLLVDDAPEMGVIVRALGRRADCDVVACADAESAGLALRRQTFDLLLLDVNLPGTSGPDFCRALRGGRDGAASLAIAVFTRWELAGDIAAGLEAGADYVLSKDLVTQPALWQERVAEILAHAGGRRSRPSLACQEDRPGPLPPGWKESLEQVLRRLASRLVPPEILAVLVRKGLARARPVPLSGSATIPDELDRPGAVLLIDALCEQLECVLGSHASRPACEALLRWLVPPGEGKPHR
jgi:CheY-like chemotaxis protein